jgi:hypothetical protein
MHVGMSTAADLLRRIEEFCRTKPMTERAFGIEVVGNHKFVSRLRSGHGVHSDTLDRAIALMDGKPLPQTSRARTNPSSAST